MSCEEIAEIINAKLNQCPHCKEGTVVPKHGRYGNFNGCSNFPKCRYVENQLSDTYSEYVKRNEFIKAIKKEFGLI